MKYMIEYGTKEIEVSVEFRNRKIMSISVESPNNILVVVLGNTLVEEVKNSDKLKGTWIVQ